MRKKTILILSLIAIFILSGCTKKYEEYTEINYNDLNTLIENKETFPLVIGSSTCSACEIYKPTMKHFIKKHNIQVYFIDTQELSEEDSAKLRGIISFDSTPTTVFYKDGALLHSSKWIVGAADISSVENTFKVNGYNIK